MIPASEIEYILTACFGRIPKQEAECDRLK